MVNGCTELIRGVCTSFYGQLKKTHKTNKHGHTQSIIQENNTKEDQLIEHVGYSYKVFQMRTPTNLDCL